MTSGSDDLDMSAGRDLDDRLVEDLLRGRPTPRALEQGHLTAAIAALQDVSAVDPQPGPELQHLFAEGLGATPAPVVREPATRRAGAWRSLGLRPLAARVAGLSLAFKLVLGGTAVAATALGGAGAAGVLPGQADRDPGAIHPEVEPEAPTLHDDPADTPGDDAPAEGTAPDPPPPTAPDPPSPTAPDLLVPRVGDADDRDDVGERATDGQTGAPDQPRDGPPTTPPAPDPGEPPVTDPTDPPPPAPAPPTPNPPEDPAGGPGAGPGAPGTPTPPPRGDGGADDPADPPEPRDRGDTGADAAAGTPSIP